MNKFLPAIRTFFYCFIFTVILSSCAQVVVPGGGKRDTTPPHVLKYAPDSAQANFKAKEIEITFDEYVQLKDLDNQLIISPPMKIIPDITIRNKSVNISLNKKDTLKPNTTYCINFGNAIQDITENNPIDNFKYIFSTGNFIDSLSVKGKVQNGFNHITEKGILVMLYEDKNDSVVFKRQPDYFGKTKEDGSFAINNIKKGSYKMIALKDANANYRYDGDAESIGFVDAPLDVSERKNILIDLFQEPAKKLFMKKASYDSYGKISFAFNKPANTVAIVPLNFEIKPEDILLDYSVTQDTLTYWFRNVDKDKLKFQIKNGDKAMDTLEYKLISKEDAIKSKRHPLKLSLTNNINGNQNYDVNNGIILNFTQPVTGIKEITIPALKENGNDCKNKNKLRFYNSDRSTLVHLGYVNDSLNSIPDKDSPASPHKSLPVMDKMPLKENTKYSLFIPPGTFTDFFGLTNDTIKMEFKTREETFYGTVKLKITSPAISGKMIVQLLDEKENVIRESIIAKPQSLYYDYLYPARYKLKIIYDENSNGKWDSGDYINHTQPEKVIYYSGTVTIRSNWDAEVEWKLADTK